MKDYPFSFDRLHQFSESAPYTNHPYTDLAAQLDSLRQELNFPAVTQEVGEFLSFLISVHRPKTIFEMGSGYGHSAFYYLKGFSKVEKIFLTEKRKDLQSVFDEISWPDRWKTKLKYHQGDAFEVLEETQERLDFIFIDGVKADYLDFLETAKDKLSAQGVVAIDNSYWRGSFLDVETHHKKSSKNMARLHEWIKQQSTFQASFIPFKDGLTLLSKLR